jgi:hypothetical protein
MDGLDIIRNGTEFLVYSFPAHHIPRMIMDPPYDVTGAILTTLTPL